jgi:hypothetical protein
MTMGRAAWQLGVPFLISVLIAPPVIVWAMYGDVCLQSSQPLGCFWAAALNSYSALIVGPLVFGDYFGPEPRPNEYAFALWLEGALVIFVVWQGIALAFKVVRPQKRKPW